MLVWLLLPGLTAGQEVADRMDLLDSLGQHYFQEGQLDSSLHYYQQLLPLTARSGASFRQLEAYNWIFVLKVFSEQEDSLEYYIEKMTPLAQRLEAASPEESDILSSFWNYKSYYHDLRGEFFQKIEGDKHALRYYESLPELDTAELAVLYQNVGTALEETGDYFQANIYSKKAWDLLKPSENRGEMIHLDSLKIIISIGTQLSNMARYREAEIFFTKGKQLAQRLGLSPNADERETAGLFHIQWGVNDYKMEAFTQSAAHLDAAKKILDRSKEISDAYPLLLRYQARNTLSLGALKQAEQLAMRAMEILQQHFPTHVYYQMEILEILGDVYTRREEYPTALTYYQKAIHQMCPKFSDDAITANPGLTQIDHGKNELLEILSKKGEALDKMQEREAALSTYRLAIELFQATREDFLTEDARIFLAGQMLPLFENAIASAIALQSFEEAFQFVEQSKALVLYEALNEQEAYQLAHVPDSLVQLLRQYKVERAYWEKAQFEQQLNGDSLLAEKANAQLFNLKRQEELMRETLNRQFPKFAELKFEKDMPTLADIRRQLLAPGQALIEYFVGEANVFVFGITREEFQVKVVKKEESFPQLINELLAMLHQQTNADALTYGEKAYAVFDQYLASVMQSFSSPVEQLFIIPDGLLSYLPFEALLTEKATRNAYSTLPYLVRTYSCSYGYSSALLIKSRDHFSDTGGTFIGFAPEFPGATPIPRRKELGPLKYNIEAVNTLREITGGQSYTHDEANKDHLLHPSGRPLILHLSTHATVDDENPMGSKIYLANGEDITTQEIYNLPYSSAMVVLSACETGTGKYYKGEGMMSLARAFMQSGSPSVVTSLWKVDDRSTSELMVKFYTYLQKGLPKNEALRRAQLDFMTEKESEQLHHPYYWAAFIHIGDTSSIPFSSGWYFFKWIGIFLLVAGVAFYLWRRKS
ncbi:MAG: CHAT domain-containing protein [Saprospiraceae bacterium]